MKQEEKDGMFGREEDYGFPKNWGADWNVQTRHGITLAAKRELLAAQGDECPTCGKLYDSADETLKEWCVDHKHGCSEHDDKHSCIKCRRDIICRLCNMALGMANDNPTTLRNLASYVERFL